MKKLSKNKKGFTLIELIVVVAILLALMLMLVPKLSGFVDEAKKTANTANARAVYIAIQATETARGTGIYDASEEEIDLCGTKVYKKFWESGAVDSSCTYTPKTTTTSDYVTYGKDATLGKYPTEVK